jgi:hypothetical protein
MPSFPTLPMKATVLHLCQSPPLARHIGTVDLHRLRLSAWPLYVFALRVPNLRSLAYVLKESWAALVFPARLRSLDIQFVSHADATGERAVIELNTAIAVIAALPLLESLSLAADGLASSCCLTPLIAAASLRSLTLQLDEHVIESSEIVEALRHMSHLRSLNFDPSPSELARLVQPLPPHQLKLESLPTHGTFTAEHGEAIVHLPTLTVLEINLSSRHTDFLCHLPNLRRLELTVRKCKEELDSERTMASLHSLAALTELSLIGDGRFPLRITAAHLAACLPHMPLLATLELSGMTALDSLRFLSSGPITRSLQQLILAQFYPFFAAVRTVACACAVVYPHVAVCGVSVRSPAGWEDFGALSSAFLCPLAQPDILRLSGRPLGRQCGHMTFHRSFCLSLLHCWLTTSNLALAGSPSRRITVREEGGSMSPVRWA